MVEGCFRFVTGCEGKSLLSSELIVSGLAAYAVQFCISALLLGFQIRQKLQGSKRMHYALNACTMALCVLRFCWLGLNSMSFVSFSPYYIAIQIMNRLSFLLLYFVQSLYVSTWFAMLLTLHKVPGRVVLRTLFWLLDGAAFAMLMFLVVSGIVNRERGVLYRLGARIGAIAVCITALVFFVVGLLLLIKLRDAYKCCSHVKLAFGVVSCLLIACAASRVFFVYWVIMLHNVVYLWVFVVFCYILPDLGPCLAISAMMFEAILMERRREKQLQERLLEDTAELYLNSEA